MIIIKKIITNICLFFWYRIVGGLFRLLPINNYKIVFENFFGKGYGDNPKYIAEELLENTAIPLKMIWLIKGEKKIDNFPPQIDVVKRGSWSELYHLATAKVWVDNSRKHFGVKKRKNQYYMQTWHGSIGFKHTEKDIVTDIWYRASAKNDSKMADVLISGSKWQTEVYRHSFWYDGLILEIGRPTNDFWSSISEKKEEIEKIVYSTFRLDRNKKIALYAPTFREQSSLDAYNLNYENMIRNLETYWGGEWVVMIRLHPNIEKESTNIVYSEKLINASGYPDINHLILTSDLIISDYSSCLFDAIYIKKPSIIYASDVEGYKKQRGFALSLSAAPALLAENNEELESVIREFELSQYLQKCEDFSNEYGIIRCGDASRKAAEWIVHKVLWNSN